jgi:hypothetical protein
MTTENRQTFRYADFEEHRGFVVIILLVRIDDAEPIEGDLPPRQKKLILGWAVLHHDELMENWALAAQQKELFPIEPLR